MAYYYYYYYITREGKGYLAAILYYVPEKETLTQIFVRYLLFYNTVSLLSHQSQKFSHPHLLTGGNYEVESSGGL